MKEIQDFLQSDQVQSLAKASKDNYKYALQHLESFLLSQNEKELSQKQVAILPAFSEYLKKNKNSGKTIQQYITIIKMLYKFHGMPIDYTYKISSREKKKQQLKKINRWFDKNDVQKCLEYQFPKTEDPSIQLRNILLVRLAAETGARIKEIANIERKDFDVPNDTVFLKKSKTEPRPAFYSSQTGILINQYFQKIKNIFGKLPDEIFPSTAHCKKIITEMFKSLNLKNDKDGRGPHTFRHYVATHLYYDGDMDLNDLAIVLGDKPDTIRDNYLHPTPEMLQCRVKKAWGWD